MDWSWNMNDWYSDHGAQLGDGFNNLLRYGSDLLFGTNFVGNKTNLSIAEQNLQFQKDYAAKMEALQRESWQREDNAVQRRVADLKAAGLSPTLAAGSAAATSSPIQLKAPQNEFHYENPFGGGIFDAISKVTALKSGILQNELLQKQIDHFGEPAWFKGLQAILDKFGNDGFMNTIINNTVHGVENAMDALGVDHGPIEFTPKYGFTFAKPPKSDTSNAAVIESVENTGGATVTKTDTGTTVTFDSAKSARDWYLSIGGTSYEWYIGVNEYGSGEAFINHIIETGGNYF